MTHDEQHRIILELGEYERLMKGRDPDEFAMFVKRDKDDEDLDEPSVRRLLDLYMKYVPERKRRL